MYLKLGRHLNVHISYKFLWLELFSILFFLKILACFQRRLFLSNFSKKSGNPFEINIATTCLAMISISLLQSSVVIEKKVSCIQDHNSIISSSGVPY